MFSENILIIFIKYPQAGFVKTRLAKEIGKVKAGLVYRLFVETILARTKDKSFKRIIFYTPTHKRKDVQEWLGSNLYLYPQKGRDLGEKLSGAFEFAFKNGAKRVVVIGTDSPTLNKKVIRAAFERLRTTPCVLGPSFDGGYYLLGLASFYRQIFQHIEWGSDKVFRQTLESLKKLKIKFSLLDEDLDIDNINDLMSLRRRLPQIHKTNSTDLSSLIEALDKILND